MADDIKIRYGSSGFERVSKQLREMEMIGATSGSWFKSMQKALKEAEADGTTFTSKLSKGLDNVLSVTGGVVSELTKVGAAVTAVAAIVTGVGVAAFTAWNMSVLKTTESFRMLETSLYGATKSWEAVNTVSEFAKKYAAEYPAMYGDIMKAMQSFAYIPALKPMIMKGDVEEMQKMMTIVQGLMTMRPEQGVGGAIWALREALAGNWRTLMMRFDVPIASIAKSAGMTMEEMKRSPAEAVKALKAFIDEFVGADTMAMMAKNLSIQVGNLKDKYEMWLDKLGKTGIYQKVVDYLLKLNDAQERFMKSERFEKWTESINKFLEDIVDRLVGVFTKDINWEEIASLGDLGDALKQIASNAIEELKKVWETAKEPLGNALKGVFKFIGSAAAEAFKEALLPAIRATVDGVRREMESYRKEHPAKALAVEMAGGAGLGFMYGGPKGAVIGAAGTAVYRGLEQSMGLMLEKGVEGLNAIDKLINGTKQSVGGMPSLADMMELEAAKGTLGEIKKILDLTDIKNVGFRRAFGLEALPETPEKKAEEFKRWMRRPFGGWTGPWGEETVKEAAVWEPKAKSGLEHFTAWSRMAKAMAEREEGAPTPFEIEQKRLLEYRATREKWEYGQMPTGEWRAFVTKFDAETTKKMRLEDFAAERERRLSPILAKAVEEKEYGVQGRIYGEMFNIAYQEGDFGRAQEYMNKHLEAVLEQMKKAEKFESEDNQSLKDIREATIDTAKTIKSWNTGEGRYSNIPRAERDELREAVRQAAGEA